MKQANLFFSVLQASLKTHFFSKIRETYKTFIFSQQTNIQEQTRHTAQQTV